MGMTTQEEQEQESPGVTMPEPGEGNEPAPETAPGAAAKRARRNSTWDQREQLLRKFARSGLTITAFCRAEGLSRKKFSTWKNAQPGWATKRPGSGFRGVRSQAQRDQVIRKFEHSGLGVAEFCQAEGLSRAHFTQWKNSLAARTGNRHAGFARVALGDEPAMGATPSGAVLITLDSSLSMSVPVGTDCSWVGALLRCLRGK